MRRWIVVVIVLLCIAGPAGAFAADPTPTPKAPAAGPQASPQATATRTYGSLAKENDNNKAKVKELRKELAKIEKRAKDLAAENADLIKKNGELKGENKDLKQENKDLKATIAAYEAAAEAAPTEVPDTGGYYASGKATPEEIAYFNTVLDLIIEAYPIVDTTTTITHEPGFSSDPSLWHQLDIVLAGWHEIWAKWQAVSVPTQRLEAHHQAVTDWFYNMDQAAYSFDYGVTNLDAASIEAAVNYISAGTDALDRINTEQNAWERETGFDLSTLGAGKSA